MRADCEPLLACTSSPHDVRLGADFPRLFEVVFELNQVHPISSVEAKVDSVETLLAAVSQLLHHPGAVPRMPQRSALNAKLLTTFGHISKHHVNSTLGAIDGDSSEHKRCVKIQRYPISIPNFHEQFSTIKLL